MKLEQEFIDLIHSFEEQFVEKNGYITCELSAHKDDLIAVNEVIRPELIKHIGSWVAQTCSSCAKYNGKDFLHLSLERWEIVEEIKQQPSESVFVKIF